MKGKIKNLNEILLWAGLAVFIIFVVITAIVLHNRQEKLRDLNNQNDEIKDVVTEEEMEFNLIDYSQNIIYYTIEK